MLALFKKSLDIRLYFIWGIGLLLEVIALGIQIYIPRLDKELITVLQKVDLWESLREEGGLDYVIDEQNSLSRGQLPKLAIARSLLGNTNVLVLDEITSSLNKESTNKIEEIINSLGNDITIIEVTHSEPLKSHSIPIKIGENEDNWQLRPYLQKVGGCLKKKLILSLVAVLVLLVGAFTLVVKQSNQKGTQSDNNANSSYRVKAYQASQYRGVYQSKGFVEVANVDYNYLLVNDGDLVYKGTTKLTSNGVYAPMTGIFSKPTSGPARIYQQAGEVTFSVNENEYREFQVGDNLKITAMDNNSQAMAGKIIALAKVPADEHAAGSQAGR